MAEMDAGIFRTDDGAEIAYRFRPGNEPWVLLHALGCDASLWDDVVAALPAESGLLIPELRGHGGSTLGWRPPSVDLWAEDVAAVVDHVGIARPAVAGISMGGYTALALAARHPDRARGYALICTGAGPDDEAGRRRRAQGLAVLQREGWRPFAEGLIPLLLSGRSPDGARHRDHLLRMFARAGDVGLASALTALANRADRRGGLSAIRVPCVVVAGDADPLAPPARAQEMAADLPDTRIVLLPGVGHLSALEAPGPVAGALAEMARR